LARVGDSAGEEIVLTIPRYHERIVLALTMLLAVLLLVITIGSLERARSQGALLGLWPCSLAVFAFVLVAWRWPKVAVGVRITVRRGRLLVDEDGIRPALSILTDEVVATEVQATAPARWLMRHGMVVQPSVEGGAGLWRQLPLWGVSIRTAKGQVCLVSRLALPDATYMSQRLTAAMT
jgi:hypothetical protein